MGWVGRVDGIRRIGRVGGVRVAVHMGRGRFIQRRSGGIEECARQIRQVAAPTNTAFLAPFRGPGGTGR